MEDAAKDELFEITERNYQKLSKSLEKEGYREGSSAGCDSIFQKSFDDGYLDGFKIGFYLGRRKDTKAKLGKCDMCRDKELINKSESEVREVVRRTFDNLLQNNLKDNE